MGEGPIHPRARRSGYWTWNFFVEVRQQPEFANGVLVRTGDYKVVPRGHLKQFGDVMKNYELKRGVVVPKGTKPHEVYDAASATLPDVTYLTLSMRVRRYEG